LLEFSSSRAVRTSSLPISGRGSLGIDELLSMVFFLSWETQGDKVRYLECYQNADVREDYAKYELDFPFLYILRHRMAILLRFFGISAIKMRTSEKISLNMLSPDLVV
jgi:hypothetical protein